MSPLFRRSARLVADHFGFDNPIEDDRRVSAHLLYVRTPPKDAQEIH